MASEDFLLGWVRMRQLEWEEAERLLRDDRPRGVALVSRLVSEMGERFDAAMAWESSPGEVDVSLPGELVRTYAEASL